MSWKSSLQLLYYLPAPESRMHKSSTFRRTKWKIFLWAPYLTPALFNKFTPMNSCDVFLFSAARPMFILAFAYFFCFSCGPTNDAVHKGPPKHSCATAAQTTPVKHVSSSSSKLHLYLHDWTAGGWLETKSRTDLLSWMLQATSAWRYSKSNTTDQTVQHSAHRHLTLFKPTWFITFVNT